MFFRKDVISVALTLALFLNLIWAPVAQAQTSRTVPAGTVLKVILNDALSSETTQEGDTFTATVAEDVRVDGRVLVRRGDTVDGTVTQVEDAERLAGLAGKASLMLRFDEIETVDGVRPIRATVVSVHDPVAGVIDDSPDRDDDRSIDEEGGIEASTDTTDIITRGAIGVGLGALLGALFGNISRGLILGSIGGAIAILAPEGEEVELHEGTGLRIRLDRDLDLSTT